jgi:hypothetical protein
MSKFSTLVAAVALLCATGAQAASHDASTSGATLALASVAGSACQSAGACGTAVSSTTTASAPSEPNKYVLFAAGLGVVGLIASRRRSKV